MGALDQKARECITLGTTMRYTQGGDQFYEQFHDDVAASLKK
jgi:hypothetical protein